MPRVYTISDVHVSFPANFKLVKEMIEGLGDKHRDDVLIVAGDVCEDLVRLRETLALFSKAFLRVFYCVGNHELWLTSDADKRRGTSLDKLEKILEICAEEGIETAPARVSSNGGGSASGGGSGLGLGLGVWVCPLMSWHEPCFDSTYTIGLPSDWDGVKQAGDYVYCRWPLDLSGGLEKGAVVQHFLARNEEGIERVLREKESGDVVVSFSHFLPREDIVNRKWLFNPLLPRFVGSNALDPQIRRLGAAVHVFAHTHIDADREIEGIRYVQKSLGYPRERQAWKLAANDYRPFCVYEW